MIVLWGLRCYLRGKNSLRGFVFYFKEVGFGSFKRCVANRKIGVDLTYLALAMLF